MTPGTTAYAASPATIASPLKSMLGRPLWLNTPPLRAEDLRGKVVLVNFWTYSCINSLRPLPYLRAWAEKYGKQGLVVIGVHTPEFGFEHDPGHVRQAVAGLGVTYPVLLDSDFAVWRGFSNEAWPGFYFIGADGRVRHRKLGEGDYAESERLIQRLLAEAGAGSSDGSIAQVRGQGTEAAPDWANLRSPEAYVGFDKAQNFTSPGGLREDVPALYQAPSALALNHWSLVGKWTVGGEFAVLNEPSGAIRYRFHARDLHLVMGLASKNRLVRFRVTIDGEAPGPDHGTDVNTQGWGVIKEDRLYQLIRQTRVIEDRAFQVEFFDPGARAYAFTFG